ncbi:AI-2E family transporter [Acinetobacter larvae]|uniref:AI-2E family transporter n=1 Tax=Acinetobacter larvae TaxID=1789224 RepID=A0A1B2LY35_9GAMM|nr:AI-2E family transporter [Acinetobacter larvae]AOA57851.1 AI-2E family transporter [Acinetobacter larvae]
MHDRTLKRLLIVAVVVVLAWLVVLLKPVLLPFLGAFLMAYLFSPLVKQLARFLPRWLAISVVFLGIAAILTLVIWYIGPIVWKQLMYARDSVPTVVHWINYEVLPWASHTFGVDNMIIDPDQVSKIVMDYVQTNYSVDSVQAMLLQVLQSGINFIQIGGTLVLIPIIAFYFLLDWERMLNRMRGMIPPRYQAKTLQIVQECHQVLGAFVKGQFLVMVLLGCIYAVGLQMVGLGVGLIIGMVAGLASIIPYLGFAVGILSAVIACFFQFGLDWTHLALIGVVFMVGQVVEGYVLQPFLLGDKIGLPPVAVVFAVLAGAQLAGFVGMLVALPVAAVIVVLLRHINESYQHSQFYQPTPQLSIEKSAESERVILESEQVHLDIEIKKQQDTDNSSTDIKDQ